jgi:hypothetical protein
MFKLTLITVEDIMGNYYNNTTIAFGKSPKACWDKMRTANVLIVVVILKDMGERLSSVANG